MDPMGDKADDKSNPESEKPATQVLGPQPPGVILKPSFVVDEDFIPPPTPPPAPAPEDEPTRWQRARAIVAMKGFYPPDGLRPKSISIRMVTDRINKLEEFQENKVSHDTVRLADIEIKAAALKK
jgi:hypothetical protein